MRDRNSAEPSSTGGRQPSPFALPLRPPPVTYGGGVWGGVWGGVLAEERWPAESLASPYLVVEPKMDFIFPLIISQKLVKGGLKQIQKSPLIDFTVEKMFVL